MTDNDALKLAVQMHNEFDALGTKFDLEFELHKHMWFKSGSEDSEDSEDEDGEDSEDSEDGEDEDEEEKPKKKKAKKEKKGKEVDDVIVSVRIMQTEVDSLTR